VRALPAPARAWWAGTLLLALLLMLTYVPLLPSSLPSGGLVLAAGCNFLLVIATAPRRNRGSIAPSFDYGGIATVALLAGFGPLAAWFAFLGEKAAGATVCDLSGRRPPFLKTAFNLAWGTPCLAFSWIIGGLVPDRTLQPVLVAAAYWFSNSVVVGIMAGLAQRRSVWHGLRLGLGQEGWLRLQEATLSILAIVAWWTHPVLLLAVVLLALGQAATSRRLFRQYEAAETAREQLLEERQRAALASESARRDPLTGLANRRALADFLDLDSPPEAVLMLDLDHFKSVNDTYGHDVGDEALVALARLLEERLGDTMECARLGGEEFCALSIRSVGEAELFQRAEAVRIAVSELRFDNAPDLRLTISIGIARQSSPPVSPRDLLGHADRALYRAKREGRNRVCSDTDPLVLPLAS
jgi:diguanylate cyclase (GGDEF)-like protein